MNISSVALYTKAQLALQAGKASDEQRLIVEMWALNRGLVEDRQNLQASIQSLTHRLDAANRQVAESQFNVVMSGMMANSVPELVVVQ